MGFIISCVAVTIAERNEEISKWAIYLILSYPITETLFSIYRKIRRKGYNPSMPDKLHLHMLVYR